MGPLGITKKRLSSMARVALLMAGFSTYFISSDDVVWRFIKAAPHARLLEHVCFGTAAAMLGVALLLKMQADLARTRAVVSSLLQAVGIGSLLPLPGFLLLVLGNLGVSLLLDRQIPAAEDRTIGPDFRPACRLSQTSRWRNALVTHIGLCCAFVSMIVFSIVLIDRVADVLFAMTALVSTAASFREAPHGMARDF